MITAFRRYLDTWVVRAFFIVMVLAFIMWGVGDMIRAVGISTWVAQVGGQTIEALALQGEYQRAMAQATRNLPPGQEASVELRRRVGDETLQRMIGQVALSEELRKLQIVTPDAAVAEAARALPAFRGADGKFSKAMFDAALRNAGLTEQRFLDMVRGDIARNQLMSAVTTGAVVPSILTDKVYAVEFEKRSAHITEFPLAAAAEPTDPDEAVLKRFYDNHPDRYMAPEFRRIKAVALTAQRLGQDVTVSDDDLRAAHDANRRSYATPAKRSIEVLAAQDEAKAKALAETWRAGADWATIQSQAEKEGNSALKMDDVTETDVPAPDLAKAAFAATPDAVTDPVKGDLAWYVIRVTKAVAAEEPSFEQVKDRVREAVVADKAADLLYDRANKVDGLLANGTSLDEMPADLGLIGLTGTLDAEGRTMEHEPAPIPGPAELRSAIIAAAFQTQRGDPPRLTEVATPSVGGAAYYALAVEDVIPAELKPFDTVKEQVLDDWKTDQQRREQETKAAALLAAIQGGRSFADAAAVAGVQVRTTPLLTRAQPGEGIAPDVQRALFTLRADEATMVETKDGFIVLQPAEVREPDPTSDKTQYDQVKTALKRSIAADLSASFLEGLRARANPRINQKNFDQIVQP